MTFTNGYGAHRGAVLAVRSQPWFERSGWVRRHYRDLDPRALELELTRARHDEWISNGEIPTKSEKEYIRVASLADLVDVAIDSNKRVIYDDEFDVYGVVAGDLVYHYSIGDEDLTEWFDV